MSNITVSLDGYIEIPLKDSTYDKCIDFAEECYETNIEEYARRGQHSKWAIIQQITDGKFAECGVYVYLKQFSDSLSLPDFGVYSYGKSYSCDLYYKAYKIHVKTQRKSTQDKYGQSYLLQKTDPIAIKPTLSDIICFTTVKDSDTVLLDGFMSCRRMIKWLTLPKKVELQKTKNAIYLSDDMDLRYVVEAAVFF